MCVSVCVCVCVRVCACARCRSVEEIDRVAARGRVDHDQVAVLRADELDLCFAVVHWQHEFNGTCNNTFGQAIVITMTCLRYRKYIVSMPIIMNKYSSEFVLFSRV